MKDDPDPPAPTLTRDRARALRAARTEAERKLWARLRGRQLKGAKFRQQHPIDPYFGDFFCFEARLAIELDGGQHAEEEKQPADEARSAYLESQGYRVLRFWNEEVFENIDGVRERIAEFL